jgi:hypothetical protein
MMYFTVFSGHDPRKFRVKILFILYIFFLVFAHNAKSSAHSIANRICKLSVIPNGDFIRKAKKSMGRRQTHHVQSATSQEEQHHQNLNRVFSFLV